MEITAGQRTWQRRLLLAVLGLEGLGGVTGGGLLVARPDGRLMELPVSLMHGTFRDFLVPGVVLLALGMLNVAAFFSVLRRSRADWVAAGLALGGLGVWFFVEIVILRELHWLQVVWGFPVLAGIAAAAPLLPLGPSARRATWLACGIASSLLYAAMVALVPAGFPGYDSASRVVSELSAVDAPTRPLWVALAMIYTPLVTAFGFGVRMAAGGDRRLRAVGTLVVVYGALGLVWPFFPMHLREALVTGGGDLRDTIHVALGAATEILYLVALGLAAAALGNAFRVYSAATVVVLFVFGALTFRDAPHVGEGVATPFIGVWQRINIGLFLAWVVVLASALLRRSGETRAPGRAQGGTIRPGASMSPVDV